MGRESSRVSWPISDDRLTVPGRGDGRRSFDAMRSKPGPVARGIWPGRSLPVVLIYFTVNIAVIRAFRTEFHDEFRLGPHLLIPAAASVVFLFPLWGILFPGAYTLANLLPFISLGWLLIGAIAAGILRARRPATFQALGRAVAPNLDKQLEPD